MEDIPAESYLDSLRRRLFPNWYREREEELARKKKRAEQAQRDEVIAQEQLFLQQEQLRLADEQAQRDRQRARQKTRAQTADIWEQAQSAGRAIREQKEALKASQGLKPGQGLTEELSEGQKPRLRQGPKMSM